MKRMMYFSLAGIVLAGMSVSVLHAQNANQNTSPQSTTVPQTVNTPEPSLGDYARAVKKDKKQPAAKQFDNDNLPREDKLSVVGGAPDTAASSPDNAVPEQPNSGDSKSGQASKPSMPSVTPGQTPQERQEVFDEWKGKLSSQQSQIDTLAKQLDLEQREYKLRAASFYGDAGERLRNEANWDKQDAEYKKKLADEQKALEDAKEKLGDMQEDARKAGVPSSIREGDQQPQSDQPPQQ
jgi:LAS superfamily LD-carboxypeptidase LdcB